MAIKDFLLRYGQFSLKLRYTLLVMKKLLLVAFLLLNVAFVYTLFFFDTGEKFDFRNDNLVNVEDLAEQPSNTLKVKIKINADIQKIINGDSPSYIESSYFTINKQDGLFANYIDMFSAAEETKLYYEALSKDLLENGEISFLVNIPFDVQEIKNNENSTVVIFKASILSETRTYFFRENFVKVKDLGELTLTPKMYLDFARNVGTKNSHLVNISLTDEASRSIREMTNPVAVLIPQPHIYDDVVSNRSYRKKLLETLYRNKLWSGRVGEITKNKRLTISSPFATELEVEKKFVNTPAYSFVTGAVLPWGMQPGKKIMTRLLLLVDCNKEENKTDVCIREKMLEEKFSIIFPSNGPVNLPFDGHNHALGNTIDEVMRQISFFEADSAQSE